MVAPVRGSTWMSRSVRGRPRRSRPRSRSANGGRRGPRPPRGARARLLALGTGQRPFRTRTPSSIWFCRSRRRETTRSIESGISPPSIFALAQAPPGNPARHADHDSRPARPDHDRAGPDRAESPTVIGPRTEPRSRYDAHTVVDYDAPPGHRSWVDFDPGQESTEVRDEPPPELCTVNPEPVRPAVEPRGVETRVEEENLGHRPRCRVVGEDRPVIFTEPGDHPGASLVPVAIISRTGRRNPGRQRSRFVVPMIRAGASVDGNLTGPAEADSHATSRNNPLLPIVGDGWSVLTIVPFRGPPYSRSPRDGIRSRFVSPTSAGRLGDGSEGGQRVRDAGAAPSTRFRDRSREQGRIPCRAGTSCASRSPRGRVGQVPPGWPGRVG